MHFLFLLLSLTLVFARPLHTTTPTAQPTARATASAAQVDEKDTRHRALVAAKKAEWTAAKVEFDEVPISGVPGLTMLVVRPKRPGTKLNELAAETSAKMGQVDLVYSPRNLDREPGKKTVAKYNHLHSRVYLPEEIDAAVIPESVRHELLHAWLYHVLYQGKDSLFHGEMTAKDRSQGMWPGTFYREHMSFQELAAFPLSLELLASELKARPAASARDWNHIAGKARILEEISRGTVDTLDGFVRAMKGGDRSGLEVKVQTFEKTGVRVRWAHVERGNVKLKVPFFGNERPTVESVARALERRRDLATRLLDEAAASHRELRDISRKLQAGERVEPARMSSALDKVKAIRALTLPEIPNSP